MNKIDNINIIYIKKEISLIREDNIKIVCNKRCSEQELKKIYKCKSVKK